MQRWSSTLIWIVSLSFVALFLPAQLLASDFVTVAERTDYRLTSSYEETADFVRRLDEASDWVKLSQFGTSPQGRALHLVIVSKEQVFTPAAAKKTGKVVMLIQNGIHAGEIDGKDACLALMRDMVVTREHENLLDSVILLVIPIFNVDGHENTARYTRANQDGPENAGFRSTAQILNLNRDYIKADAPEMRAWLTMWQTWMPDFFVDDHVTDGGDWQHTVTYTMPWHPNAATPIREWTRTVYDPYVTARVAEAGYKIFPYVFLRGADMASGVATFVDIPRFSTGYTALWNRPGLLVEMHSLKDYRARVLGNYAMLVATLEILNRNPSALNRAIAEADSQTAAGLREPYPLSFEPDGDSAMVDFEGYESDSVYSAASGRHYTRYHPDRPHTWRIPYFGTFKPRLTVIPPRAYLIPREWGEQRELLLLHGVRLDTLIAPFTSRVERYRFDSVTWARELFEDHVMPRYTATAFETTMTFPAGTVVVNLRQPAAKVAIQALEPKGPDSFVAWGLWNTIFEQKEYIEDYVIDPLGEKMLASDPALKAEFEARLKSDTTFANSPQARRDFFYRRSDLSETQLRLYPVARHMGQDLPSVAPWEGR